MPGCAIFTCKNRSSTSNMRKEGITYHSFPKEDFYRRIWISSCNNHPTWEPTRTSTICSRHFDPSLIITLPNKKRKLENGAIPTLYLSDPNIMTEESDKEVQDSDQDPLLETGSTQKPNGVYVHLLVEPSSECQDRTAIERKLIKRIKSQSIKIKSLQSKVRYYKKKALALEDILKQSKEEYLIDIDDQGT